MKLSRTNFGFFSLTAFAATVLAAGDLRTMGVVFAEEAARLTGARLIGTRLAAAGVAFLTAVVVINKFPLQELKSERYIQFIPFF